MTPVYSGGLVYEYSMEENDYGLVRLGSGAPSELPDFDNLKTALAGTQSPKGDGGAKSSGTPSNCPAQSDSWDVTGDFLPAIPEGAKKYMDSGAGKGVGLQGAGSQNSPGASTGTATPGSGAATATGSAAGATKTGAAASLHAPKLSLTPIVCGVVVVLSSLLGATLL